MNETSEVCSAWNEKGGKPRPTTACPLLFWKPNEVDGTNPDDPMKHQPWLFVNGTMVRNGLMDLAWGYRLELARDLRKHSYNGA